MVHTIDSHIHDIMDTDESNQVKMECKQCFAETTGVFDVFQHDLVHRREGNFDPNEDILNFLCGSGIITGDERSYALYNQRPHTDRFNQYEHAGHRADDAARNRELAIAGAGSHFSNEPQTPPDGDDSFLITDSHGREHQHYR